MTRKVPGARAEQKRADRRAQIVRSAVAVFAQHGYHGTSIDDIIADADIARGTFYLYFTGKAAVFDEILDESLTALRASIRPIEFVDPTAAAPHVQLRESVARVLTYITQDRSRATVLLARHGVVEADAAERLERFYSEVKRLIARGLEHGIRMGLLQQCDAALTAAGLLGLIRGILEEVVLDPANLRSTDSVMDTILTVGLRGISA